MASNSLKSIFDIFDRKLFRIPDYQRGYSWKEKHLKAFWDDIDRLPENKNHYTGLLTLEAVSNWKESGVWQNDAWLIERQKFVPYHIVDGQQRITSVIILINIIINQLKNEDAFTLDTKSDIIKRYIKLETNGLKSYIFGYEENDPSYSYFKTHILGDTDSSNQPMDMYTINLRDAKTFFEEKLQGKKLGELEAIYDKVTLRLLFNLYEIEDEIDVYVTFETTNNRGKPLSKLELLKNRLIYLSTIIKENGSPNFNEEKVSLRNAINENWKIVYELLGKNPSNILDDDDFLKNHVYMYFGHKDETEFEYSDFLLETYFTAQNAFDGNLSISEIRDYVNSIGKSVKEWYKLHNAEHFYALEHLNLNSKVSIWLSKLNRIGYPAFSPSIMALLQKTNNTEVIVDTLKYMERFIFLVLKVTNSKSNSGKNFFYRKANELWSDRISLPDYQSHIISRINEGHDFTLEAFKVMIFKLYEEKRGFYDWVGLRYFLFEYELWLQNNDNESESKVTWSRFNREGTIEHIFPQTPKDAYWSERFGNKFTENQIKVLQNSLGNLLLLSSKKNPKLSNYGFEYKKTEGYSKGSYSELEVCEYEEWNPQSILSRGIKMLQFLEKRWNTPINNSNEFFTKILICEE